VIRRQLFILLGAFTLANLQLSPSKGAELGTAPCTCGANVRPYLETRTTGIRRRVEPESAWCSGEGRALLQAAYSDTSKVPPGFRGNSATNFDQIVAVYWVVHPSPSRIVGSYRMGSTLSHAASLDEARREFRAFLADGSLEGVVYPFLAGLNSINEHEQRLFFEFDVPATIVGKSVAFRVWKTQFLAPTTGWLLADADRTGLMSVGTVPKDTSSDDVSLFLEEFWWESGANDGSKVLDLPKIVDTPNKLLVKMPVVSIHGGDMPDEVYREVWSVRVNRRTGEMAREIEPDILCRGHESRSPHIVN
jgi:hypothetical protein